MPIESVLMVITRGDSIGGAQVHVRDLARALQQRGVRVALAAGTEGALQDQLAAWGIPCFRIPGLVRSVNPLSDLLAIRSLVRVIRAFRPQVIHCHTAKAGLAGRLAAWWCRVPSVFTVHGWQFAAGVPWWQSLVVMGLETVLSRLTRTIVTVSRYDRELALRYRLGSPRKIVLVHNGIPWREACPARDGSSRIAPTVRMVMVARFQEQKDHACLFAALEQMENLPWTLELAGDGPGLPGWKKWVTRRGWSDRVSFRGQTLNVAEILEACAIFVLASRWEGFPLSILEAMRAGLPVVASDVGGCRESVMEGKTGFLVPARDPGALAERLKVLVLDPALRARMGEAGRLLYEKEFTFERMVEKTMRALS